MKSLKFSLLIAAVLATVSLQSCSKNNSKLLVGDWQQIDQENPDAVWTFESNGTFRYFNPRDFDAIDIEYGDGRAKGVWTLSDIYLLTIKITENESQFVDGYFETPHQITTLDRTTLSFICGYSAEDSFIFKRK